MKTPIKVHTEIAQIQQITLSLATAYGKDGEYKNAVSILLSLKKEADNGTDLGSFHGLDVKQVLGSIREVNSKTQKVVILQVY